MNCVSIDFVKKRNIPLLPLDCEDVNKMTCANGQRISVKNKIKLKFSIEGVKMESFFYVIPNLNYQLVLGSPFMHDYDCVHDYNKRTLTLMKGLVTTYMYDKTETVGLALLTKYIRIPPNCEMIVPIKFSAKHSDSVLLIEPMQEVTYTKKLQGLLVARVLLANTGQRRCRMLNLSNQTIRLRANTVVGSISRIDDIVANFSKPDDAMPQTYAAANERRDETLTHANSAANRRCDETGAHVNSIAGIGRHISTQTNVDECTDIRGNDAEINQNVTSSVHDKTYERKYTLEQLGIKIESDSLTEAEKRSFYDLIDRYNHIFALTNADLPVTDRGELKLRLKPGAVPFRAKPFHQSADARAELERQLQELLRDKWIERSTSPWSANCIMVRKKDSSFRAVFDMRGLNSSLEIERFPLMSIDEVKDVLATEKAKYYSSLDMKAGYHSLPLHPDSRELTAFRANGALYQHTRCPEGIATAPATYSRLMNLVLAEEKPGLQSLVGKRVINYLDDILIMSATPEKHLKDLENVFIRIQDAKLRLSPKKCHFCQESVEYLGQSISAAGLSPLKHKLDKLMAIPEPKNAKQLKIYLGAMGYYRRYLPLYGRNSACLNELLRKDARYVWTSRHQEAYNAIQESLKLAPTLNFPLANKQIVITSDASLEGTAYVIHQTDDDGKMLVLDMGGRALRPCEAKGYTIVELELMAIVEAVRAHRHYLQGNEFLIRTDSIALKWLKSLKNSNSPRLFRWSLYLSNFNYQVEHLKGKDNVVSDAISRLGGHPPPPPEDKNDELHDDDFSFCAIQAVSENEQKSVKRQAQASNTLIEKLIVTENDAELTRHRSSMHNYCCERGQMTDSQTIMLINTDDDDTETNAANMLKFRTVDDSLPTSDYESDALFETTDLGMAEIRNTASQTEQSTVHCSMQTDATVHTLEAIALLTECIAMTSQLTQTDADDDGDITDTVTLDVMTIAEADSQVEPSLMVHDSQLRDAQKLDKHTAAMIQYLEDKTLPIDNKEAREIVLKADNYFLDNGILYHRTITRSKRTADLEPMTTQVCVPSSLQPVILKHYHDGMTHRGIERTYLSLRKAFYWPKLYESVVQHVRYCTNCQVSKSYSLSTSVLKPISAAGPWDFVQCDCMHVQASSEGHRYIFVLIDQFTSWPFLFPLKQQTSEVIADCILHVTAQVGFFRSLYTDLASTFTSRLLIAVCKTLGITKVTGAAHQSKSHGKVERRMRTIWEGLRCMVKANKDWHKHLTTLEMSLRNSPIPGTDLTPFEMNYGRSMRLPVQALIIPEIPQGDILPVDMKDYVDDLQTRLKTIHETTARNIEASNKLMQQKYDERFAKPYDYKIGQSVWMKQFAYEAGSSKKLNKPWQEVPYTIESIVSPQEVTLRNQETGEVLKTKVATNNIKVAYLLKDLERIDEANEGGTSAEPGTVSTDDVQTTQPFSDPNPLEPQADPKLAIGVDIDDLATELKIDRPGVVVAEQPVDDTYYPAQKLMASKKMGRDTYYKVRWVETNGVRPPDSWSREEDVSQDLLDVFKRNFTLGGKRRKRPLTMEQMLHNN